MGSYKELKRGSGGSKGTSRGFFSLCCVEAVRQHRGGPDLPGNYHTCHRARQGDITVSHSTCSKLRISTASRPPRACSGSSDVPCGSSTQNQVCGSPCGCDFSGCRGAARQAGGTVLVARHKLNQRVHLPGTGAIRLFVTRLG